MDVTPHEGDPGAGDPVSTSSASLDGLDLTPRDRNPAASPTPRPRRVGRFLGVAVLVGVVTVGAVVVVRSLNDATLYFRNADEAVAQRDELGTSRFRLQGVVEPGTVQTYPGGVAFDIVFNGVTVPVEHTGDPAELFDDGIPVVLEGAWSGTGPGAVFLSDRMLVKHDENYVADNSGRIDDAGDGVGNAAAAAPTDLLGRP